MEPGLQDPRLSVLSIAQVLVEVIQCLLEPGHAPSLPSLRTDSLVCHLLICMRLFKGVQTSLLGVHRRYQVLLHHCLSTPLRQGLFLVLGLSFLAGLVAHRGVFSTLSLGAGAAGIAGGPARVRTRDYASSSLNHKGSPALAPVLCFQCPEAS